jgi:hypothetical protein
MERCRGQAAMVNADHINSWLRVWPLVPLLKHTKYYYFCEESMCRLMPKQGEGMKYKILLIVLLNSRHCQDRLMFPKPLHLQS